MDELSQSIRDLPLASTLPLIALILAGLVLWIAGRRVLRGAFAIAGGVLGLWGGFVFAGHINVQLPAFLIAIICGLLVASIAALVYRLALAGALVLVCGIASPLAIVTVAELQGLVQTAGSGDSATEEPAGGSSVRQLMHEIDDANAWLFQRMTRKGGEGARSEERADEPIPQPDEDTPLWGDDERAREVIEELQRDRRMEDSGLMEQAERLDAAQEYSDQIEKAMRDWWERNAERVRPAIVASAFIGVLTGLLLATFAPGFSAILVSAVGGSLAWLGGTCILLGELGGPVEESLPSSATVLLLIWIGISLLGVAIQWIFRPKRADTRS